jgi:hypothetical protein
VPAGATAAPRFATSVRAGVLAFVIWRTVHALVVLAFGGSFFKFFADGSWYHTILVNGYGDPGEGPAKPTAFFPLLPWLTRGVQFAVRSEYVAALIVTMAATVAALVLVHRMVTIWRNPRTADVTLLLLLVYPASAFLWQFLTESLLIALSAGALLAQHHRRPALAGALAALATMTRIPGIFVAVALVAGELQRSRRLTKECWWYACGLIGVIPIVIAQHVQAGDGLGFMHASYAWHRTPSMPWTPVVIAVRAMRNGVHGLGTPLDLAAMAVFVGLVYLSFRRPWPWSARLLVVALVLGPIFTTLATSMSRYMIAAWPAFAVAADRRGDCSLAMKAGILLVAAVTTLGMLQDWSYGNFVG